MSEDPEETEYEALSEKESGDFLSGYGIPVVTGSIAYSKEEAVAMAAAAGYPVVLKGTGKKLLHKTERGLVHVNLEDEGAVASAAGRIIAEAAGELDGILVQPLVTGKREFVAGLFRDRQFGPVVMFGLGGIYTEALADTAFRLAPLTDGDVDDMLSEIRAKSLLGDFRGERAADRTLIADTLKGLSRIGMEHPDIAEIDINPLIVDGEGNLTAVDALVVKGAAGEPPLFPPPVPAASIGFFFHPKPIVFVGASAQIGKWGHLLLTNTLSGGFAGDVYLVSPKGGTIAGKTVHRSVEEIEGDVDLAVVTIPAAKVRGLIPQFKRKGIKSMLLISSGFGETGEEGQAMERALVEEARAAGILILGPNTMGILNPHIDLYCTATHVRPKAGSTLIVSQSGNMGNQLIAFAEQQGIGVRCFCGSGNEAMITMEDMLEAGGEDPLTKSVMLYLESAKNGRRFFETARKVGRKKPVVLLKGGESAAGNRAAASHTGALASDSRVFDAMCRQAGIIKVPQSMDMLDLAAAFSSLPLPRGNRVAIMTLGGGWGVITADLCDVHGLVLPELSKELLATFDGLLPPYWNRANPVDLVGENDTALPMKAIEELIRWDGCDAVINMGILGKEILTRRVLDSVRQCDPAYTEEFLAGAAEFVRQFETDYVRHIAELMERYEKPVIGVNILSEGADRTVHPVPGARYTGVFFPTPERAVKSLASMYRYGRYRARSYGSAQ